MTQQDILMLITLAVLAVIMGIYYSHSKKKLQKLAASAAGGVATLFAAASLLPPLGVELQVNCFTVLLGIIGGPPGIALVVMANL